METIIPITGAVTYQLTLDPTVWIFDDRKLDLNTYFTTQNVEEDADVKYMREVEHTGHVKLWKEQHSHLH